MTSDTPRTVGRRRGGALAVMAVAGVMASAFTVLTGPSPSSAQIAPSELGAAGEMHVIAPQRIVDTRLGTGVAAGSRPVRLAGRSFDARVLGVGDVPARSDQVLAVLANITVTDATVPGYVTASPCCGDPVTASNINFSTGRTVANMAVIRPGDDGRARFTLAGPSQGTAHVIVDLFGWVSSVEHPTRGARLVPVTPGRLFDSRRAEALGPRTWRRINVRGANVVDADGKVVVRGIVPASTTVTAVMLNVTGINERTGATGTWMSLVPERVRGAPSTSNLNLSAGQVRGNLVVVPIGPDGRIFLYNDASTVDAVIDVVGYFQTGAPVATRAGRLQPMAEPFRVFDTRQPEFGSSRLGANQAEPWDFAPVVASTTVDGLPIGRVSALLGNLTATGFERQRGGPATTYLTMYPGPRLPESSNINLGPGEDVANLALAPLASDLTLRVYNAAGSVHYLYDLSAMVLAD
jgi:hypothetical protein